MNEKKYGDIALNNRTGELFSVKYSKMLNFSHVAEALMGLIYHGPSGENFSSALDFANHRLWSIFLRNLNISRNRLHYNSGNMMPQGLKEKHLNICFLDWVISHISAIYLKCSKSESSVRFS